MSVEAGPSSSETMGRTMMWGSAIALLIFLVLFMMSINGGDSARCEDARLEIRAREACVREGPPACITTSDDALELAQAHQRVADYCAKHTPEE